MIASIIDHGLPALHVTNPHGEALIHLNGAHVVSFQPAGQRPVLWMSSKSLFEPGKPIRGGVPLCAPWFGPNPTDPKAPAHGLIRQRTWEYVRGEELADGRTRILLAITSDAQMFGMWPHPFSAEFTVTVGASLALELAIRNTGTAPFLLGEALHTYLAVSAVQTIQIHGLAGAVYIDKVDQAQRKTQGPAPIMLTEQTDRVYFSEEATTVVDDPGFARRIVIRKSGSGATVVWNPWSEKAKAMADFAENDWPGMVCIEAANAADSVVVVPPSFTHHLGQMISVEPRSATTPDHR